MPIDFQDGANRLTYSGRRADPSWAAAIGRLVDPVGRDVADVGCGGGTYTRAWLELGAATVIGVDSSAPILAAAEEAHGALPGVRFRAGEATATGLPAGSVDVVFERALVHHVPDLVAVVAEAARVLRPGGVLVVQDRTLADVALPGSSGHPRGWLFEVFPRLLAVEAGRRPAAGAVEAAMSAVGLVGVQTSTVAEVRRRYPDGEQYLAEIAARTGRSILHELDDSELAHLVDELRNRLPGGPVVEQDRWTIWCGRRPGPQEQTAAR